MSYPLCLVALLAAAAVPILAQTPPPEPGSWLNARDFGASGSDYETTATTTADSKQITVADPGDFREGEGVMISRCNPRITKRTLWGPRGKVAWEAPLQDRAEIRGYNGDQGDWLILVLDVAQGTNSFRWSEDICRTWSPETEISGDWQPLRDGIEVRFNEFEWEQGYTVVFAARGQLMTTIEKIEGNVLTLKDAPTRSAPDAVVKHCDDAALQATIDLALKSRCNVLIPPGRYRLSRGLRVANPQGLTIQGANPVHTTIDISDGEGACLTSVNGSEITLRNLTFSGHSGFEARDQCGHIPTRGSSYFWGFAAKNCNATTISGTERALVENCHGTRMASECFVAACKSRGLTAPGTTNSTGITYLRCTATDLGRNAFNDVTCGPENTSVLQCRIVDVGGCAWEGASRFVRFIGNYVRNAGTVAMGNLGEANRDSTYPVLGAGQHIIADNVFESLTPYGGCAIRTCSGATQVLVRNNLFVNFGSSAVEALSRADETHYPSSNTTITGNIFDMTSVAEESRARHAVFVTASDTLIGDNQIYVRGACDPVVTGIRLREPAQNVTVHGNLIRNCGQGIETGRVQSRVREAIGPSTFRPEVGNLPALRADSHLYRGWCLAWLSGAQQGTVATIASSDPETFALELTGPHSAQVGDRFEVFPPEANWNLHSNTITGCLRPVILDSYGSATSIFSRNTIARGDTAGVKAAVEVHGTFQIIGNQLSGFDEEGAVAFSLFPDAIGRICPSVLRDNIATGCTALLGESHEGLIEACTAEGNVGE